MATVQEYVNAAVQALARTRVYVDPGTEGVPSDATAKLLELLTNEDDIVLVMLPSAAIQSTSITAVASLLSDRLGNKQIIGLAAGRSVIGHAPNPSVLQIGVAAEQMRLADSVSVSSDAFNALRTFTLNIHRYQAANPKPKPPTPTPLPPEPHVPGPFELWLQEWLGTVAVGVAGTGVLGTLGWAYVPVGFRWIRTKEAARRARKAKEERSDFKVPFLIKGLLTKIVKIRSQINDEDFRKTLYQLCLDVERYFKSSSGNLREDTRFYEKRLEDILSVLGKFVDIQNFPRYYLNPEGELTKGRDSVSGFSEFVLDSIRQGSEIDLFADYEVNTRILQAARIVPLGKRREAETRARTR